MHARSDKGAINIGDTYGLTGGHEIPQGTDLDQLFTTGVYFSPSATWSDTLLNLPDTNSGFKLIVENLVPATANYRQTLIASNSSGQFVFHRVTQNGKYLPWTSIVENSAGVLLKTGDDLNKCVDMITYQSTTGTLTNSLLNKPTGFSAGFRLENKYITTTRVKQILYTNNVEQVFFMRAGSVENGELIDVTPWYKFAGEVVE